LTLDIGKGLTPDISVFLKEQVKPNLFRDVIRFKEKPILAIEVISSSQTIQEMLDKASTFVSEGINTVWTIEPYSRTVFVTTQNEERLFHTEIVEVENEQIRVDFSKVFQSL
jgi:Uma2 family endonuclease